MRSDDETNVGSRCGSKNVYLYDELYLCVKIFEMYCTLEIGIVGQ